MPVDDGGDVRVGILWEDNGYTSAPNDSSPKVPGGSAQLTTNEATNNGTRITLPATRTSVQIKPGTFDGAWALEWRLTNPWWARAIRGAPSTVDNGDGTYTHTYDGTPDPFRLVEGYESQTKERVLKGCIATSVTAAPAVGDDDGVQMTMEGFYATEHKTSTSMLSQATLDFDVLGYEDAELLLDSSTQTIMQDASLTLAWENSQPIQGFSSRFAIDYLIGNFAPEIDYTKLKVDDAPLSDIYGGSTSMSEDIPDDKTLSMEFDNGVAAGSGKNNVAFNATGTLPESYSETGVGDIGAAIEENLSRLIADVDIVATNETATAP